MKRYSVLPSCLLVILAVGLAIGCSSGPSEQELAAAALKERLAAIVGDQTALNQQRDDLIAAKQELAELEGISKRELTDEQKLRLEELPASIEEAQAAIDTGYEALQGKLATFLNDALNNYPDAAESAEALKVYSEEAMVNAEDVIQKSGDYKKGMEALIGAKTYYEAVGIEPLPELEEKAALYDQMRFMTEERFELVQKGMTMDEVRATAGVPYYRNIKEDTQRKTTMWLYPRREGGAASVTFDRHGKMYNKNFDAVKPTVVDD